MREAMELHDSTLVSVLDTGTGVSVTIDAYIHREPAQPEGPGTGWQQKVDFQFDNGVIEELSGDLPWTILEGGIAGVLSHDNLISLPCEIDGNVSFQAAGNARVVRVRGTRLRIVPVGAARYIEETPAELYAGWPAGE